MLKLLGILCILSGSTGFGLLCAQELELRIQELQKLQEVVLLLRGEIRYVRCPLCELFFHAGASTGEPFESFFIQTAEDLQQRNGQTSEEIWKKNMRKYLSGLHISRSEYQDLEKLGSMLGCLDAGMQINALDYYEEQLRLSCGQAREASRSRRRLYQYMGALAGAALVILIF